MPFYKSGAVTIIPKVSETDVKLSKIEEIENRVLRTLEKPKDFDHIEVKDISNNNYRINVVTKSYKDGSIFPIYGRPTSWVERGE